MCVCHIKTAMAVPACARVYHRNPASTCLFASLTSCCSQVLIPGGSLRATRRDMSHSSNIQGLGFYSTLTVLRLKLLEHCSAHFHTYCLFCLLRMLLYKDPSLKGSVFFKPYLTAVNTAEMPLWSDSSHRCSVLFLNTHLQRISGAVNLQHRL